MNNTTMTKLVDEADESREFIAKMVTIQADADRRVCRLECPMDWTSLRPSIGHLQSLQELNLKISKIESLPDEIGNLGSQKEMSLEASKIESLPRSIGRLQSLQSLNLSYTRKLKGLPDEIGNLGSLKELSLEASKIESLPRSIGGLQSLRCLNLRSTKNQAGLPDEIGNLGSLVKLNLQSSNIESLSPLVKYTLVCSKFKYRAAMGPVETRLMTRGLPLLLNNTRCCFKFNVSGVGNIGLEEPDAGPFPWVLC